MAFQSGLRKNIGWMIKIEALRHVKVKVKEELKEVRDENADLLYQLGMSEGRAKFLARENEVLLAKLSKK